MSMGDPKTNYHAVPSWKSFWASCSIALPVCASQRQELWSICMQKPLQMLQSARGVDRESRAGGIATALAGPIHGGRRAAGGGQRAAGSGRERASRAQFDRSTTREKIGDAGSDRRQLMPREQAEAGTSGSRAASGQPVRQTLEVPIARRVGAWLVWWTLPSRHATSSICARASPATVLTQSGLTH
jgi:hypothetical protein